MIDHDPDRHAKAVVALRKLPPKALQVFLCNQVEGMTYIEIAKREGMSVAEVQRHMLDAIRIIVHEMR
ncbi:sigma factor-like helix-turn-helix DNA-binding protein [Sphingobium sp. TCM1]|uniref:sigma factor-like helix-turn-helix DNA-binding protein n=1 Tax=Sphingobium sp. TCM1 TaxID=453246 RepID=UPI0007F51CE2|nr:sigma factor-like helix-turn-helix DNA-binding protein [Sphingobium sp. TCM1]OAN55687.1 hypothetical protein A7Q26_20445 [Sphingobium sp. TCM1]